MANDNHLTIGEPALRVDALKKVTGKELYAIDHYGSDLVWAGVKRAGIPHARLKSINTQKALGVPGVLAVLTSKDVRGSNKQGVVRRDQQVLITDKIRHCGDPVALVVAENRKALQDALSLISIDYEPLPGVFNIESALQKDAELVHEDNPTGNILLQAELQKGEGGQALTECDAVVEAVFNFSSQEHAYLETESGTALFDSDGNLHLVVSTQSPFRDCREIADALGIPVDKILIKVPYCGGAFGGKDGISVQNLLGLAAQYCPGRTVKMWWDREESFLSSPKRHSCRLYYKLGAKKDGTLHALENRLYYDTGPYDHLGGAVMVLGLEHSGGPYRIPHVSLKGYAVYTNNPIGGPFRGFGVPQVNGAIEQVIDMLADKLGISPLEIRTKNAVLKGDRNPPGMTLVGSTHIQECLEKLKQHPLWTGRDVWKSGADSFKRRGVGIACVMHGMGYGPVIPDSAQARIELMQDGRIRVYCGVVDMGQGNSSTFLQIAGDILHQNMFHMDLILTDTKLTFPSGSATASRTTYTFGCALTRAAEILKVRILEAAGAFLKASPSNLVLSPGKITDTSNGKSVSLSEIAGIMSTNHRIADYCYTAPIAQESLTDDTQVKLHGLPHVIFSYGVHLALVEVDEITGNVNVVKYLAIHDSGNIVNPQSYEQQVQGGIVQGIGYALYENFVVKDGRIITGDLSTYILPGAMDVCDIESITIQKADEPGVFGMKGAGEIPINGPLPAIANAVADACGVRTYHSPLTPESILLSLSKKRKDAIC